MIRFECACGAKLKVNDDQEGREFECPKCGERVSVPMNEQDDIAQSFSNPPGLPAPSASSLNFTDDVVDMPSVTKLHRKRSRYPWCRRLQFILRWNGILSVVFVVIGMIVIFISGNENNLIVLGSAIVALISSVFTSLALSELLGGTVAFLLKNDCDPN